jgi:hypothetical protein
MQAPAIFFTIGFELVVKPRTHISLLLASSWWWSHQIDIHHVSSKNAPGKKIYDTQAITPRLYKEIPYIPQQLHQSVIY